MQITYQSRRYDPAQVTSRHVRAHLDGTYRWCEVGPDPKFDVRQGTCTADELPPEVRQKADARRSVWPPYVPWPLEAAK